MDFLSDYWFELTAILFWLWIGTKVMSEQVRMLFYAKDVFFTGINYQRIIYLIALGILFWPVFSWDSFKLKKMCQ